jgi:NAD(P)-dependent dehydrogenase (short-subunit alcohol dehydrogenase family)
MAERVLVTGGGSGIGAATCELLRSRGIDVIATDVADSEGVRSLDVTNESDWDRILDSVWPLTGIVNCAGVRTRAPIIDLDVAEFDRLMHIHARGTFLAVRMPARRWLSAGQPGSVVTIASVVATHAVGGQAHYVASKAAVAGLVRAAAAELAADHIRVNAIAPGVIRTPMTADRLSDPAQTAWLENRVPAKRVGEAVEIAEAAAWLLSDAAAYVNGIVLAVDGGWTAT